MAEGEFVWGGWRNPYQYILGETHADIGRLSRKIADVVNNLADELYGLSGKEWRELPKMQAYSGRGMMGKYCLGVSVGSSCLSATLKELEEKGIPKPVQDALGMGAILYWQNIPHDKAIHRNTLTKQGTHESVEIDEADASSAKTTAALSSFLRKWRRNEDEYIIGEAVDKNARISQKIADVVNEVCGKLLGNTDHYDLPKMRSYSGRGMYGQYCLGVDVGRAEASILLKEFKAKRIPTPSQDAMGMGVILYWQSIPYDSNTHRNKHVQDESVDHGVDALAEAKRQPEQIYFSSYTAALNAARAKAEREGYEIDEDDWNTRVTHGYPSRPAEGETTNVKIGLSRVGKGGKPEAAMLVIAVYGMKQSFELTSYISKVRMGKHEVQVRRGHGKSVGFRESVEIVEAKQSIKIDEASNDAKVEGTDVVWANGTRMKILTRETLGQKPQSVQDDITRNRRHWMGGFKLEGPKGAVYSLDYYTTGNYQLTASGGRVVMLGKFSPLSRESVEIGIEEADASSDGHSGTHTQEKGMDSSDYGYRSGYRRYEYLLNEDDFGDSMMGGVHFFKEKTPPYQGLPDEKIIGCYRDGKKIAEIWTERGEDYKNPNKVTGYTVYPPWKMGKGAMQGTWDKSFSTMKNPFGHPVYKTPAAALAAAKKFVIGLKTEEVASDATAVVEIAEADARTASANAALSSFLRKWRRNEDDNAHGENVLMLARFVGSPEEVAEAKGINREHDRIGHLPSHLNSRRYALYLALKQKFQAKYPNATLGESVEIVEADANSHFQKLPYLQKKVDLAKKELAEVEAILQRGMKSGLTDSKVIALKHELEGAIADLVETVGKMDRRLRESVEIDEAADRINEQKSDPFNWRKGDTLPIHERNPRTFEVFAGLFDYSGFGMGNYHSKNGRRIWTDRANAERLAKSDGVELVVHDRFKGSL
jgi:hypothetical protein